MTLVIPNVGEANTLEQAFRATTPEALILKLYSNDYDPIATSVHGSFTEATIAGYAAKTLTRAGWSAAVGGSPSSITYGTLQTFSFTGTGAVVGYYLVGATSGTIYWAERMYAGAGQTFNNGDECRVTPKITYASATSD